MIWQICVYVIYRSESWDLYHKINNNIFKVYFNRQYFLKSIFPKQLWNKFVTFQDLWWNMYSFHQVSKSWHLQNKRVETFWASVWFYLTVRFYFWITTFSDLLVSSFWILHVSPVAERHRLWSHVGLFAQSQSPLREVNKCGDTSVRWYFMSLTEQALVRCFCWSSTE